MVSRHRALSLQYKKDKKQVQKLESTQFKQ